METADGTRQQQLTDNRTLIKLSIFMMNTDTHHNIMNLKHLFTLFSILIRHSFLVIFVILISSSHLRSPPQQKQQQ